MAWDLPDELIDDILLRLPVKHLLRFRCVCKTWCALIDSNTFVKQHLNHSVETNNNKLTLIFDNYSDIIYSLGLNPLADQALELAQPIINPKATSAKVLGSCNGLLCLFYESLNDLIVIWNPATRKHVMLPHIKTIKYVANTIKSVFHTMYPALGNPTPGCTVAHGFGYDSVSDDYKVVILVQFFLGEDRNILVSQSCVYSLRSDSWRVINDAIQDCVMHDPQRPDALVRNAIHWLAIKRNSTGLVVAFDLATYKYRLVTLPEYHVDDHVMGNLVSELGGCLSIVFNHYRVGVLEVWVMKDYGATESWTKLFTISSSDVFRPIELLCPLVYSVIGDEVLLKLNSEMLFWYNLETRTVKFVDVHGAFRYVHPVICLESLVSLGHKAEHDESLGSENEGPKEGNQNEEQEIGQPIGHRPSRYEMW